MIKTVAVVILNWNGKNWLQKFLPSVLSSLPSYAQLYVADNASSDDSIDFLKSNFSEVHLISLKENYGFAKGYNEALKHVEEDVYVLLNSDIEIKNKWIEPIIDLMQKNEEIAVCQPKILDQNKPNLFEYAGACGGYIDYLGFPFCRGRIFNVLEFDEQQYNNSIEIFWATGACMFIKKEVFWEVGGLDGDYFAHMEEIDLCWRIKKRKYKIYVEPKSEVYHVGGGTLQKISPQKTYLNFRNNLYTLIKNLPSKGFALTLLSKLILDGVAGIKFLIDGDWKHFNAVVKAHFTVYQNLVKIFKKRKTELKLNAEKITGIYPSSIVWEHFVQGKKTFNQLKNKKF